MEDNEPVISYDEVYTRPEYYWGKEPNRLCQTVVQMFEGVGGCKRVIDLGCGEGKDVIHFAQHGFTSEGLDLSRPGLEKAERWAAQEGLPVQTIHGDIVNHRLSEPYDVLYSSGTLTFLPAPVRSEVFQNYKQFTKVGGLNAFNVFVEKPYLPTPPDWGDDEHFYRSGELLTYYWDWEIVVFKESEFDCDSGGIPHRHAMDVLIARKV